MGHADDARAARVPLRADARELRRETTLYGDERALPAGGGDGGGGGLRGGDAEGGGGGEKLGGGRREGERRVQAEQRGGERAGFACLGGLSEAGGRQDGLGEHAGGVGAGAEAGEVGSVGVGHFRLGVQNARVHAFGRCASCEAERDGSSVMFWLEGVQASHIQAAWFWYWWSLTITSGDVEERVMVAHYV